MSQEKHDFTIPSKLPPLDCDQPHLSWVFKNLDFQHWENDTGSQLLSLYGPPECNIRHIASHIVNKCSLDTQCTVLYFFCLNKARQNLAISHFILVFLYQFIVYSSKDKQESIVRNLLRILVKGVQTEEEAFYTEPEPFNSSSKSLFKNIFGAPAYTFWTALVEILTNEPERELLVVFDGLENVKDETGFIKGIRTFFDDLQGPIPKMKVLLTSQPQDNIKETFKGLPYIEHDMERRGRV